jgi:LacI family transcriptional regulator
MSKPTIHDVAARAGVSKSTVSLVLQDSPLVKADKRDAVRRAMADLGYVYNAAAAGLRGKSVAQQGLMLPLATDLCDLDSAAFAAALQRAAAAKGMGVQLLAPNGPWAGRRISTLQGDAADDLTLTALHPNAKARAQEGLAAAKVTRHLLGLGAVQVAFVGGDAARPLDALRIRGYLQRLAKAQVPPLHLTGGDDYAFGWRAVATLLASYPACTAALCISDAVALGMQDALAQRGIRAGDAFRLVGWGDTMSAQTTQLSSIRPAWDALAQAALAWVMNGGDQAIEIAPELVRRASSMGGA